MKSIKFNRSTMMCCITLLSLTASMTSCAKKTSKPTDPVTVTDVDGNVYTTVRIGTQLWMTENLRTTRYKDGTAIPTGLSNTSWGDASAGAFAIYAENNAHNTTYGKLYNWYAVNTGKLAPEGWHVPSRAEWETLVSNLGGSSVAGGKLKAISSLWNAPNLGASNSSGFAALPSGYKGTSGGYELMGESAYWWASSARNASQADYLRVDDDLAGAAINGATKQFGYAVRCIKD
ncbi:hypothetical protein DBR32_14480 [Taibaiella sp. KBW10]|uniref:fibrobacter succinogenes major paralogous domain-containing protein n=1 Tax=Taibaiella sp. KBW10 TaxID=2153357 RepID=UPI000F593EE6|nr:fibrobacter succinogenes major paralogous domain-containing protein [Taibaiella sp. KBW10]RQO29787.1 hypothetical protein DBR32_14480 [Taibaiella sp. KBW10]